MPIPFPFSHSLGREMTVFLGFLLSTGLSSVISKWTFGLMLFLQALWRNRRQINSLPEFQNH